MAEVELDCNPSFSNNSNECIYSYNTILKITDKDIEDEIIKYIKSDENQDRELLKYKELPDKELLKVTQHKVAREIYDTLCRLIDNGNINYKYFDK